MEIRSAFEKGRASGGELFAARNLHARSARPAPQGLVIGQGDCWFDHPGGDVLSAMEDLGFDVEASAAAAATIEDLSFNGRHWVDLYRLLARVKAGGRTPKALLLSAGLNDLMGHEFSFLVNHDFSGLATLNSAMLGGFVEGRLRIALSQWIGAVDSLARGVFGLPIRIVIHGYDYPVPDGRGYVFGPQILNGPWLRPGFWSKGHTNLQRNRAVVRDLINGFNDMQQSLVAELELPNLGYVDLRNTLSSVLYENDWDTEVHPTEAGFRALARKIAAAI